MRFNVKIGTLVAAGALAIAVPAAAHPGPPDHSGSSHASHSHKCKPRNAAYIESGTVDATTASTLAQDTTTGRWSGTLVVDVTKTNHWAGADKGSTVTYTFTDAKLKVRFDDGTTGLVAGERVKLIGKLAVVAKKCAALSPASTPVFRMVVVHPAPTS